MGSTSTLTSGPPYTARDDVKMNLMGRSSSSVLNFRAASSTVRTESMFTCDGYHDEMQVAGRWQRRPLGRALRTLTPRSKLSSDPLDMMPWRQYTVSGIPCAVLKSASTCAASVRSALIVIAFALGGAAGSTISTSTNRRSVRPRSSCRACASYKRHQRTRSVLIYIEA